jgi:NDP-sugar pyrophosphorylase family protein
MQCVILAGGLGTRMRPETEQVPKALLPVAGRPFVDHQLELVECQGYTDVVVCTGHLGELLREHVGDGGQFGLSVAWSDDGPELRGTGGALRLASTRSLLDERFGVLYGDSYLPIDARPVHRAAERAGLPGLMTVYRNQGRWETSNVVYADGIVERYAKGTRDPRMQHIDYGLSVLTRAAIDERIAEGTIVDLATTLEQLSDDHQLAGFEVHRRFYEIGSPSGLADLEALLAAGPPDLDLDPAKGVE